MDIKPAFTASKFPLPDEIIQAIEKKAGKVKVVSNNEVKAENSELKAGPVDQIEAWKIIENKKFDKSAYESFLEDYGYNTPLSVVAQNRISDHAAKKRGGIQRFLFWVLILPGAIIALYLNIPKFVEKVSTSTQDENSTLEAFESNPATQKSIDKQTSDPTQEINILPKSLSPKRVLSASNAETRYKGWHTPNDAWFGRVNSITFYSGDRASVFLSSIPEDISIFVSLTNLPPDIDKKHYVKVEGEIGGISNHISLINGNLIKTDRASVYRRFHKDYDDVVCVQKIMTEQGYYNRGVDGVDGDFTKLAVKTFLNRSSILPEMGLSKSSTYSEICQKLDGLTKDQYLKKVREKKEAESKKLLENLN